MKKIIAMLLALVMVIGLVACGGAAETPETELQIEEGPGAADIVIPEKEEEPAAETEAAAEENPYADLAGQTVKWWTYPYGEDEARWPQVIEKFTEKTGINVELTIIPWGAEGAAKLSAGFLGGVGPDVLYMTAETAYDMISGGHLADLTTVLSEEVLADQIYADATKTNGVQYMLPMGVDVGPRCYFFNKALLEEAGVEAIPTTREELIAAALKIKEAGVCEYPVLMPTQEAEAVFSTVLGNLWSNGADFMTNGEPSFNTPEAKETMQYLYDLVHTHGVLSQDANSMNANQVSDLFAQGKVAIMGNCAAGASSPIYEFMSADEFVMVPYMAVEGHDGKSFNPIDMLAVNANSEVPEAAAAWMTYLVSSEGRNAWNEAFERKGLPCNYSQVEAGFPVEFVHPDLETMANDLGSFGRALPIGKGTQTMLDGIIAEVQLMFAGEQDVDTTCEKIQAACIAAQEG